SNVDKSTKNRPLERHFILEFLRMWNKSYTSCGYYYNQLEELLWLHHSDRKNHQDDLRTERARDYGLCSLSHIDDTSA
ncbi:MAG: hypothetical protein Q7S28_00965, partial [bacterium]|nr:hypothetical protein [bacterium]